MISLGHYFLYLVSQPRGVSAANFLFNLRCMAISHAQETGFEVQPRIIDILTLTEVVPGDRWQIFIKTCKTILAVVIPSWASLVKARQSVHARAKCQLLAQIKRSTFFLKKKCWLDWKGESFSEDNFSPFKRRLIPQIRNSYFFFPHVPFNYSSRAEGVPAIF